MAILKRLRADKVRYVVQIRDSDGQWFERKSFDIKVDAKAYESELISLKRRGTKAKSKATRDFTLTEFWDQKWSVECRAKVSPGWKISQDQMWRDHIQPVIGKMKIIEIRTADIQSVLTACRKKPRCGTQMQIHIFSMLHKIFDDAIEIYDLFDANPVKKKLKPERPEVKRAYLTPAQAFQFLETVKDDPIGVPVWIMMLLGLRIGEVQGLRRKSVHLDTGHVVIEEQWNSKVKAFTPPKNKRAITIPMPQILTDYLEPRISGYAPDDFVAPGRGGNRVAYKTIHRLLKVRCKEAGLPALSPHELRHTCSGIWRSIGAGKEDIRVLFNHKNSQSTETYIHESNERLTTIAKTLGNQASDSKINTNVHHMYTKH